MNEADLAVISLRLDEFEKKLDKVLDDHEDRLRAVERWLYALPASIFGAAAALIVALVK